MQHEATTAQSIPIVVQARRLTKRFGRFVAVDHVDLAIRRGEIFGFVGPNGCGKTTTMRMLAGLLVPDEGEARVLGERAGTRGSSIRRRLGYMGQTFSLYAELTVRQNLTLQARLFDLPHGTARLRIGELLIALGLEGAAEQRTATLPLGLRQRLALAAAIVHRPELLILDEPTSGVDPLARERFWGVLQRLAREEGVTVFLSTHFMSEAARCDRLAFMDAGRVLAVDSPSGLLERRGCRSLEEAFVDILAETRGRGSSAAMGAAPLPPLPAARPMAGLRRLLAFARREALGLGRDPIRLGFSLGASLLLLVFFGFGLSFDVEHLRYAVLDQDQTPASRLYLDTFAGTRFFAETAPLQYSSDADRRLRAGDIAFAVEIPPRFGRDLAAGREPEVGYWLDGSSTFRAETARAYVQGAHALAAQELTGTPDVKELVASRFRYNQGFESVVAIVPGVLGMMLAFVPSILTALGIVREKELGSIANFETTPTRRLEFLLGKQLPYAVLAYASFVLMALAMFFVFGLTVKGSLLALAAGAALYVIATTSFGLLVSAFTSSQIAAIFACIILTMLPAMLYSGMVRPVSSLTGASAVMANLFPNAAFHRISIGTFTKALGVRELWRDGLHILLLITLYLAAAALLLRKQER